MVYTRYLVTGTILLTIKGKKTGQKITGLESRVVILWVGGRKVSGCVNRFIGVIYVTIYYCACIEVIE
jgi:hypothetical protein